MKTPPQPQQTADILIVGAGLAGLMAANALQAAGHSVLVVEKGRGLGGRLSTWRLGPGRGDYGAQFFTVRTPQFMAMVEAWQKAGLVFEWARGWATDPAEVGQDEGFSRYAVHGGMTAVAKQLAQPLSIHTQTRLVTIQANENGWDALAENGRTYQSRALLLTPPVPQSLALLDAGDVLLSAADRIALEKLSYAPCLSGLFWVEGDVSLPVPGAVQQPDQPISWIADNRQKGISPEATIITAHANPTMSQLWYEAPEGELMGLFNQALRPYLGKNSTINARHIHRWRYALPLITHPERTLLAEGVPPMAFAGDAFNGPRIEGAALSGVAAAEMLANLIQTE